MAKKILLVLLAIVAVMAIVSFLNHSKTQDQSDEGAKVEGEALDAVSDFYNGWLDAVTSTTTSPQAENMQNSSLLSDELKAAFDSVEESTHNRVVFCTDEVPTRVGMKVVFETPKKAQYFAVLRGLETPVRPLVDVAVIDNAWRITDINCENTEIAPEQEFTFVREGRLLKNDEPPLDPDTWYVVYEENDQNGWFAPLSFTDESVCVTGETEAVCNPDQLPNTMPAIVKGEMHEWGVDVKRIEFIVE